MVALQGQLDAVVLSHRSQPAQGHHGALLRFSYRSPIEPARPANSIEAQGSEQAVCTQSLSYTVGQVVYHVLIDIVTHRTDHEGELPLLDRKAWEDWWRENEQQIVFSAD